ncbi:MAG: c-type cytochrome [Xanthomonadaceae bacterium]|nr:c-type cytochrome [Xanthomonadaceae bacterium]
MRALSSVVAFAFVACAHEGGYEPVVSGGDAKRGRQAIAELECGACHQIPGVPGAWGRVGPPLAEYRHNVYIAGKHPNVPDVLVRFVRDAPSLAPDTAMPAIEMSDTQARDVAAYLYSLE